MKTKSFQEYLEKRLNKKEIAEIKEQAEREIRIFKMFQTLLADMIVEYMKQKNIGFNELARLLDASPSQLAKIQKGEANLRLSSVAHLFALMDKEPTELFKK